MTNPRHTLGQRGEAFVAERMQHSGYTILDRNWRHGAHGELDIIARHGDELVFVEVRTRQGTLHAAIEWALSSVDAAKQSRLVELCHAYMDAHGLDNLPYRIDVAAVGWSGGHFVLEVIHNAVDW